MVRRLLRVRKHKDKDKVELRPHKLAAELVAAGKSAAAAAAVAVRSNTLRQQAQRTSRQ